MRRSFRRLSLTVSRRPASEVSIEVCDIRRPQALSAIEDEIARCEQALSQWTRPKEVSR